MAVKRKKPVRPEPQKQESRFWEEAGTGRKSAGTAEVGAQVRKNRARAARMNLGYAVFMLICRMPYVGLISVIVGVTNLIPNFGPAIGAAMGAFILLLADPKNAVLFLVFCLLLQSVDAYILKPKLFSGALGVSGLTILVSTIVLGSMFGVTGVLLAIPAAAIISFVYHEYYLKRFWRDH